MNDDRHDCEAKSPQLPGAEPGRQAQLDDQDLRPDEAAQAACISEPKLVTADAAGADVLVDNNREDTQETTGTTAGHHRPASVTAEPCQTICADRRTRKPTLKQRKFAVEYADPHRANGNGTLAARLAGYTGNANVLAGQAYANLRNLKVQQLLAGMVDSMTERALQRLGEALDATTSRAFLGKNGTIIYTEPVPDHKTRLHAAEFVFDLRGQCGDVAPPDEDELEHDAEDGAGGDQVEDTDRVLFEQAAAIEDKLAELESLDSDDHEANE